MSDHRDIGTKLELFFFDKVSPGSCFFLPHGTRIYNALIALIREMYWKYNFMEVITPNMYDFSLWKTSGHADHFKENMFMLNVDQHEYALKPMNCAGHCVIFDKSPHSYKTLPIRYAEFGVLHRNEMSGSLTGISRVRKFVQDDAHIFCTPSQLEIELSSCLDMVLEVYTILGLKYDVSISTRPSKFVGLISEWNIAEDTLKNLLSKKNIKYTIQIGDGAFYGPKCDFIIHDILNRKIQCATIQLDYQLPQRFNLKYQGESSFDTPIMIHRAILGSFERIIAILIEFYKGKFPLWLSPRQIAILPVTSAHLDYCKSLRDLAVEEQIYCDIFDDGSTLNKKIQKAQDIMYNYIVVVGKKEIDSSTVSVRLRDTQTGGSFIKLDRIQFIREIKKQIKCRESIPLHIIPEDKTNLKAC